MVINHFCIIIQSVYNYILGQHYHCHVSGLIYPQYGDKEVLQYAIPQVLDKKQPSKVTQLIPFPPEKC